VRHNQSGFTLIEIAIVLVIIGLLLGGVLKGQELITSARVRNIISQQDGAKAAYFGFQDRFRALPGDYTQAAATIAGVSAGANGDGDGQVETNGGTTAREDILVWDHLSHAGFITGSYTFAAPPTGPNNGTNPTNPYGSLLQLVFDNNYQDAAPTSRHLVKTGAGISSELLAEVDRKIDDGRADLGAFRYSSNNGATAGAGGTCFVAATGLWATGGALAPNANCGAASLL
jgi:prepilin-type N-terminal cleavage/methylation domain-containing protein